jgi:hypothetical protein
MLSERRLRECRILKNDRATRNSSNSFTNWSPDWSSLRSLPYPEAHPNLPKRTSMLHLAIARCSAVVTVVGVNGRRRGVGYILPWWYDSIARLHGGSANMSVLKAPKGKGIYLIPRQLHSPRHCFPRYIQQGGDEDASEGKVSDREPKS